MLALELLQNIFCLDFTIWLYQDAWIMLLEIDLTPGLSFLPYPVREIIPFGKVMTLKDAGWSYMINSMLAIIYN